jgi:uncharacterized membrane protein
MIEKYLVYIALFSPLVGSLIVGIFYARSPKNIFTGVFTSTTSEAATAIIKKEKICPDKSP